MGKKAHAAFTGVTAGTDLLAVSASAGDVGVRLTSDLGTNIAINGPAWQSGNLVQGDNVLHFKAMLKTIAPAAPATVTVNEGDFTGQANFTLSYL
ncbi:hypothetical protein GTGU_04294 [Trabulsiella guamensis ATCC 49490]|uniref:Fimbrial-type adhesion domain-containing protein n=1 Tax=Trabulsiella guamensis ATCC 49490 TaxID=1005994 RepID=A0A084ZP97_9ENTR|nr:hypothetical protein GTGU_04294 [Trabulsiella guamensis ATCC 49490]